MVTPWKGHANEVAGEDDQEAFVLVQLSEFKNIVVEEINERPSTYFFEESDNGIFILAILSSPFKKKEYYQKPKMPTKQEIFEETSMHKCFT